jgi:hypothetical protein
MPPNNSTSLKRKQNLPLAQIRQKLLRVKKRVGRLDDDIDDIYQEFDDLVNDPAAPHARRPLSASVRPAGVPSAKDRELQRLAKEGVAALALTFQSNGSGSLKIDGRDRIPLPPRLAALAAGLILDTGHSPDQLVSWKSDAEIIAALERRTQKKYRRHTFNHLFYLLRAALKDKDENPWLVMRDPKFGSRFALRRALGGVNGANHN